MEIAALSVWIVQQSLIDPEEWGTCPTQRWVGALEKQQRIQGKLPTCGSTIYHEGKRYESPLRGPIPGGSSQEPKFL